MKWFHCLAHGRGNWIFAFIKMRSFLVDFVEMKDFVYLQANGGITAGLFYLRIDEYRDREIFFGINCAGLSDKI